MIGYSILKNLFDNVIATGLVKSVFHSVMMKPTKEGGNKPAAPINGRWEYVGIDDTAGFSCYCRQNGSADVSGIEKIGGCNHNKYRFDVPHRIVFFHAGEKRSHEEIISRIMKAVMKTSFIRLQKLVTAPEEILRSEAPTGKFAFKDNTLYFSIEFFVLLDIQTDSCSEEIKCEGVPNPYCTQNGSQ